MLWQRNRLFTIAGLAQFSLPGKWRLREPQQDTAWVAYPCVQWQSWWFGAGNPLAVAGWLVFGTPQASELDLQRGMDFAFRDVQVQTVRFPEFGNYPTGTRTTWISMGCYQHNELHDPKKVIFLRSLDPVLRVVLVLRVYLRSISHARLRGIERNFFGTLRFLDGRP